jgi:hypothetical protein
MHGPPDALWCYESERFIGELIRTPNNGKDFETTLTKRQNVAMFVRWLTDVRAEAELQRQGRCSGDGLWEEARGAWEGGLVFASSQEAARKYADGLAGARRSEIRPQDESIALSVRENGVAVGSLPRNWRKRAFKLLLPAQRVGVNRLLTRLAGIQVGGSGAQVDPRSAVFLKSVQMGEHNFGRGDFVVVKAAGAAVEEEFGRIDTIYCASDSEGQRRVFVDMAFFRVLLHRGRPSGADQHNSLQLTNLKKPGNDRVRLATNISRHFIPCPAPGETVHTGACHVIEVFPPQLGFTAADVWVPQLPKVSPFVEVSNFG